MYWKPKKKGNTLGRAGLKGWVTTLLGNLDLIGKIMTRSFGKILPVTVPTDPERRKNAHGNFERPETALNRRN